MAVPLVAEVFYGLDTIQAGKQRLGNIRNGIDADKKAIGGAQVGQVGIERQPSLVDDDHPIADGLNLLQYVGGKNDRRRLGQSFYQTPHVPDLGRVQAACRLVQDKDFGGMQDRLRHSNPLPISSRERIDRLGGLGSKFCVINRLSNQLEPR